MSMRTSLALFTIGLLLSASVIARQRTSNPTGGHTMPMAADMMDKDSMKSGGMPMTKAQKLANARSAAPASISGKATIFDWPDKEGAMPPVLQAGSNGWNCFPDMPETKGNDPMCVDATWMKWIDAYLAHSSPRITSVGIGYMMASGGGWGSNSDPFAMSQTADNKWGHHNPHLMILVPDLKSLTGLSTDPDNGGPYVMFAGTPYAHVMAPTTVMPTN